MGKVTDYRAHADECRMLARGAISETERAQLLAMAGTWESLAKDRERFVADHPELSRRTDSEANRDKTS